MQRFLEIVARQIYNEHGDDLSRHTLVFPNRRSSLFFSKYLSGIIEKPLFSPGIKTINELFSDWSDYQLADPLFLVFSLYDSYKRLKKTPEPFDEFYFWGEMILNDFDDIDKYLVDHRLIFQNLRDLRDIDSKFGGLEPELLEIIRKFWTGFDPGNPTPEKEDFLAVWDILAPLYSDFREGLLDSGLVYEGIIMRDLIERLSKDSSLITGNDTYYHFIGFNALNRCEKELFRKIKNAGRAYFYWDYDKLYVNEDMHEAGFFLRENIAVYGQDLEEHIRFDNLLAENDKPGRFEVYKAPSDVAQAKLLSSFLRDFDTTDTEADKTAIVLADENMLMPVLNSIPGEMKDINVTMGYPLYQTPVYSLVHQLLSLRKNIRKEGDGGFSFYHADILKVLSHQYISFNHAEACNGLKNYIRENNLIRIEDADLKKNDFFDKLFSVPPDHLAYNRHLVNVLSSILARFSLETGEEEGSGPREEYMLQNEYLYRVITSLNRLESLLLESSLPIGIDIYIRIVDKILHKLIVPFSGEPLRGVQLMGILETRALDFENIIIVSVNEGVLPRGSAGSSYIPYNLRMAFGLPTVKHQDSIFAYYFYRLLQRAKKVRFLYNSNASGMRTGEMSRFLLQLKYKANLKTVFFDSRFNIVPAPLTGRIIQREPEARAKLEELYLSGEKKKALSPSALNTWISCRMKFYYRYVIGLEEADSVKEEVDSPMFGTILHDAMNELYSAYIGRSLSVPDIDKLIADKKGLERVVYMSFRKNYLRGGKGEISGRNLILTSVLKDMIEKILTVDRKHSPLEIIELENKHYGDLHIDIKGKEQKVQLGGYIDRIDNTGSALRILDYKTGKDNLDIDTLESLTGYNVKNRNSAAFQTFVYSMIYSDLNPSLCLRPSLYPVRAIYGDRFSDVFEIKKGEFKGRVNDFRLIKEEFRKNLKDIVADIFNPERDFDMTDSEEICKYCPFNNLCARHDLT